VWERRYDFPNSTRSSGGHRLYSQQDVFRLQWVKMRIDEGMRVSRAIRALQRAEQDGTFMPVLAASSTSSRPLPEGVSLALFHKRLLNALMAHDVDEASLVMGEAQALYPIEQLVLEMIGPTLQDIGAAWEQGRLDVATEHLATNQLRHFLMMWMRVGPPAYAINPAVLACAPGELHEGSLLMLGVLLRRLRWPVLYLGQTMPLNDLSMFFEDLSPSIAVFVAMTEDTGRTLAEWPLWLPEIAENKHPVICYGGQAFVDHPELIEQVQGIYLGDTLQEGLQKLNNTLHKLNPILH
jgi:DNA-binding transcriptional MerR regulator